MNNDCTITIAEDVTIVKILVEKCKRTKIIVPASTKITTSVVEIWRCDDVEFHTSIEIGTLQADICALADTPRAL